MQYEERLEDLAASLEGRGVAGVLLMCTPPEAGPRPVFPSSGRRSTAAWARTRISDTNRSRRWDRLRAKETPDEPAEILQPGDNTPDRLADYAGAWKAMGAQIIGGCWCDRPRAHPGDGTDRQR